MKAPTYPITARLCGIVIAAIALHLPVTAHACAACVGYADSTGGGAGGPMNAAIFLMLGCIGGVLSLLCAFGIYLYRRSQAPIPPHVQLAEMIGSQSK
jgi:hypothetical protein